MHTLTLDSLMNQIVSGVHESNIINGEEMERNIKMHPLFSSIVADMEDPTMTLHAKNVNLKEVKQDVKRYKKYVFTDDALIILANFLDFMHKQYPSRKALEKRFPLFYPWIAQIFVKPPTSKKGPSTFVPKIAEIDINKPLYHTTNAFEIFEMKKQGTPFGPAFFNIDTIYPPEKIQQFHPNKGGMRVIQYKWIPSSNLDFTIDYPFVDVKKQRTPKILDARKLKKIPSGAIEKYFETHGIVLDLPEETSEPSDILSVYGKTWRPFIVRYLEKLGFDGILVKNDEIVLFHPDRWITFSSIDHGDMLYSALIEALQTNNKFKIPEIAAKYNLDLESLMTLFTMNKQNIQALLN